MANRDHQRSIGPCRSLEVDLRAFRRDKPKVGRGRVDGSPSLGAEIELESGELALVREIHQTSQRPACLRPLGQSKESGSVVTRALDFVRGASSRMGSSAHSPEWFVDSRAHTTSAGRTVVHLHQHHRGVPVFEAMQTAVFNMRDQLFEVHGDSIFLTDELPAAPGLDAAEAVLMAARYLREIVPEPFKVTDYPPKVLASPRLPALPTTLHKLPFEDPVTAHLIYFDLDDRVHLGWYVALALPKLAGNWDLIVDACGEDAGSVLWMRDNISAASAGRGSIWLHDPGDAERATLDFPLSLTDLPPVRPRAQLPDGFPNPWITDRRTSGNNALVKRLFGSALEADRVEGRAEFSPAAATGTDQQILNAFYFCNYIHDVLYLLGFDESFGNFQLTNLTPAQHANDRLEVSIETLVRGDAKFEVRPDGASPRMALGETAAGRHTALSADVVFHECIHGLTDRLVGGRNVAHPMQQSFESRALDEGICDWFALTVQNHARISGPGTQEQLVFGAWAAANDQSGLRPRSYDGFRCGFQDLRRSEFDDEHAAGQVWCAALLEMNRRIGDAVGDRGRGHEIGWQLMVDALKEMSRTPLSIGFLRTRDRIFEALTALALNPPNRADDLPLLRQAEAVEVEAAVKGAFLTHGMGPAATSADPGLIDATADPPGELCPED